MDTSLNRLKLEIQQIIDDMGSTPDQIPMHRLRQRLQRAIDLVEQPTVDFGFEEQLRIAIGTALIQSGYIDQDEETGTIDLLKWHPCPGCPKREGAGGCACSGVPYLSDEVWDKLDVYGHLSEALQNLESEAIGDRIQAKEIQTLFDKEWEINRAAIKRWQDEDPEKRSLTWPDPRNLLQWLMEQWDNTERAKAGVRLNELRALLVVKAVEHWYNELIRLKYYQPGEVISLFRSDKWPPEVDLVKAFENYKGIERQDPGENVVPG